MRIISTSYKTPSSQGQVLGGKRGNIWLTIGLYTVKLVLVHAAVLVPVTSYAGVFSFIGGFVSNKEADAASAPVSEYVGVLEAHVGPSTLGTGSVGGSVAGEIAVVDGSALLQESGVNGTQADLQEPKSTKISLYVVRQGDSLSQIAKMFGVTVNTIVWANGIKGSIREGDKLVILPISGVSHKVVKGDTVRSLATKYKADMEDIKGYNNLSSDSTLAIGSIVLIPDGEVTSTSLVTRSSATTYGGPSYKGYYMRPIEGGVRTQGLHGYNGVDIGAPTGTPIFAAAEGTVIVARGSGYNGGYGSYVVISHPNGTQTLYAHMSRVSVSQGEIVSKGQTIGLLGSTGKSTGPHIHFEIRGAANPF